MTTDTGSKKLTLFHKDYSYPLSRNPYQQKLKELKNVIYDGNETEKHQGKWLNLFKDPNCNKPNRELHVEIGCNGGHVVLEWAQNAPENAFVGLDWKIKQIYRGAVKATKRGIQNLVFFRAHAERIEYMFGPGEIDSLYLFFPDPWPKTSQLKNRYVKVENLVKLAKLVKENGRFEIKTDHQEYFKWMLQAVQETNPYWKIIEQNMNIHKNSENAKLLAIPEVTLFEKVFVAEDKPIARLVLSRTGKKIENDQNE
ncbi:MAG: tRNA (guanosine(46)-N7)-methyltransferase TrmB [Bdellovibrionales bacterium RIFOXYD1_FULL_44_7]|nr:MAG: tRNA (guanosine(46)-N7)-methyltransferase TrmB [Bdellovibrionales bacterium RIFOXYD1_FULL_44_7]